MDFDHETYIPALEKLRDKLLDRLETYRNDKIMVQAVYDKIVNVDLEIQSVNEWVRERSHNHAMEMFIGTMEAHESEHEVFKPEIKMMYGNVPIYTTANQPGQKWRLRKKDL